MKGLINFEEMRASIFFLSYVRKKAPKINNRKYDPDCLEDQSLLAY